LRPAPLSVCFVTLRLQVEQFIVCPPESSAAFHDEMIAAAEEFYQSLGECPLFAVPPPSAIPLFLILVPAGGW
jgi:hypothetical protein